VLSEKTIADTYATLAARVGKSEPEEKKIEPAARDYAPKKVAAIIA